MPRRVAAGLAAACLLALVAPLAVARADEPVPVLRVGYGEADATWQIGAGGGQYAKKAPPTADGNDIDPQLHSASQQDSYGVASRLSMRAIVLEGTNGLRIALVKSDNYLAQNYLLRRVGQLLTECECSAITPDHILHSATHNHSSPYYATPSWGVWLFQDVMDLRAFEYQARAMTTAILRAEGAMEPARMGATVVNHEIVKANIAGHELSHDGTPAGYADDFGDHGLTVMRFEQLDGTPIAAWANWGQHPESLDGHDLITADYLGPLQRMVERETGAPLVFSQGDVGSSEGPYWRGGNEVLADGVIKAWAHVGHAQMERGARYLADSVAEAWNRIGDSDAEVPLRDDLPVGMLTYWAPGPVSHPYPSVGNCRSKQTLEGDPGAPAAGLPDCQRTDDASPVQSDLLSEGLRSHGIPVPANYDAPSHGAVEENYRLQLQVVRIGDVVLGSCSCEAQVDLILNFESRANDVVGDIWDGYPWDEQCTDNGDGNWTCPNPSGGASIVTEAAFRHMEAQIHNDAAGWDTVDYAPYANSDPAEPAQIKGNFTKEEALDDEHGYKIAVGLGHTGDYSGYTVSYREYMARDSYRKALTSYGPHTADYMVTRLVRMAMALKSGTDFVPDDPLSPFAAGDEARQESTAQALGRTAGAAFDGWHSALADDAGPAAMVHEPSTITRFDAATIEWIGGSNAVDNPTVRVERLVDGAWQPYADQSGEIQTRLDMPDCVHGVADTWTGQQSWHWTATFEAFDGFPARLGQVPDGTYRFVVDGVIRHSGSDTEYHLESAAFDVTPWEGITVSDLRVDPEPIPRRGQGVGPLTGDVSFVIDPILYPRTYTSSFRYVDDDNDQRLCRTCAFRPWATEGTPASATVTVTNASGKVVRRAEAASVNGRWVANTDLHPNEIAWLERGAVRDTWGEGNLARYGIASDGSIASAEVEVVAATATREAIRGSSLPISSSRNPLVVPAGALVVLALIAFVVRRNRT